ncbi:uncharacterized protein BDW70DRAFT_137862 [Aspergillus foveolatus]|uniref:uncharacterized protein n=1 Tax=Aspergillus foveolatus TaxID=210207 RepID=UPI003CCDAB58
MESALDNDNFIQSWDLSGYDAIELVLGKSDGKTYTLALEDDRSFLSWEAQFRCINEKGLMTATREVLRFSDLVPQRRRTSTFMSAHPRELDLQKVRRFGIWIYSSGSSQEGPFSLSIYSINAVKLDCSCPCPLVRGPVPKKGQGLEVEMSRLKNRVAAFVSYLGMKIAKPKPKRKLKQK